jgi:hypothetical protein
MSDQVTPGPCPTTGCPPPTEIDCIQVTKVYDFCFQADTIPNVCAPLCMPAETVASITCTVTDCDCDLVGTPVPASTPGFVEATFLITCTVVFTLTSSSGNTCTTSTTASFIKTVVLCGPAGTAQSCTVVNESCSQPAIIGTTVCTTVSICVIYQSTAYVALLVPTYGFCTPAPCSTAPLLPCPPSSLFPPQCT